MKNGWEIKTFAEVLEIRNGKNQTELTEALDFSTPGGRALAGMLSTFAEFERDIIRERVKAGIVNARAKGKPHGRPLTAGRKSEQIWKLKSEGMSNSAIARKLKISRGSVINYLPKGPESTLSS